MNKDTFPAALVGGLTVMLLAGCFGIRGELFADPGEDEPPRLRYNGYYFTTDVGELPHSPGTVIRPVVLWRDGTAASLPIMGKPIERRDWDGATLRYGTLAEAHVEVQEWIRTLTGQPGDGGTFWGNFRVEGDAIRIRVLWPLGVNLLYTYEVVEYEGVVLSDTSFVITTPWFPPGARERVPRNWTFYFHPFEGVPPSTIWTHRRWRRE